MSNRNGIGDLTLEEFQDQIRILLTSRRKVPRHLFLTATWILREDDPTIFEALKKGGGDYILMVMNMEVY